MRGEWGCFEGGIVYGMGWDGRDKLRLAKVVSFL